jgi:hypothetical protein
VLKLGSNGSDVFPKVLKLSSEVSECKPLPWTESSICRPVSCRWISRDTAAVPNCSPKCSSGDCCCTGARSAAAARGLSIAAPLAERESGSPYGDALLPSTFESRAFTCSSNCRRCHSRLPVNRSSEDEEEEREVLELAMSCAVTLFRAPGFGSWYGEAPMLMPSFDIVRDAGPNQGRAWGGSHANERHEQRYAVRMTSITRRGWISAGDCTSARLGTHACAWAVPRDAALSLPLAPKN